jgi:hypothetical protein
LPPLDEYAVNPQEIKQGVVALKKRQRNLMLLGLTTSTVCIASVIGLFFQQELVYGFFGLSTQLQQLHLPVSVDANLASIGDSPDYFFALIKLVWLADSENLCLFYWCIFSGWIAEEVSLLLCALSVFHIEVCRLADFLYRDLVRTDLLAI